MRAVLELYEEVLDITDARGSDTVFSLGGDSLQCVIIAGDLEKMFGFTVPPEEVGNRTIDDMIAWLRSQGAA
jgi:acyl carrier protein